MGDSPCIVDLSASSDEDDDEDLVCLTEFPAHLAHRRPRKSLTCPAAVVSTDIVILEDVDKTIELHFEAGVEKPSQKSSQNSVVLDDDCCILDQDPSKVDVVKPCGGNDSEDLVMTGESGHVACRDYPHARHLCAQFPFKTTAHKSSCPQCHCYVCDTLAPCSFWGDGTKGGDHCHASDKSGEKWKILRRCNKGQPPGRSDLLSRQQMPPSGIGTQSRQPMPPSGIGTQSRQQMPPSGIGTQSSSYRPAYEGLLFQSKELVAQLQVLSDFSSDQVNRVNRVPIVVGDSTATNNSRGVSPSPPVNTGYSESTSFRGLLGCHIGDSARSQYPLQIKLNHCNREPSAHPRRHHSQDLGVHTKFQRYLRRKEPHLSSMHQPYQPEGGGGCLPRRNYRKNICVPTHRSLSSFSSSSTQIPHPAFSALFPRRPWVTPAPEEQDSFEDRVPDETSVLDKHFLGDLSASPTFLPSHVPDSTGELQQQCPDAESISVCSFFNFESANRQGQNESGAYGNQGDTNQGDQTAGSCNSVLDFDSQFSRAGPVSERKVEGNIESLPKSPPTLLVDYLLGGGDFWSECELPENFVNQII